MCWQARHHRCCCSRCRRWVGGRRPRHGWCKQGPQRALAWRPRHGCRLRLARLAAGLHLSAWWHLHTPELKLRVHSSTVGRPWRSCCRWCSTGSAAARSGSRRRRHRRQCTRVARSCCCWVHSSVCGSPIEAGHVALKGRQAVPRWRGVQAGRQVDWVIKSHRHHILGNLSPQCICITGRCGCSSSLCLCGGCGGLCRRAPHRSRDGLGH